MSDNMPANPSSGPEQSEAPSSPRVVVLDPDFEACADIKKILNWCDCITTGEVEDFRRILRKSQAGINLVLLDPGIASPEKAGVLSWLQTEFPQIPVVVISADQNERRVVQYLARGASDLVQKPFTGVKLKTAVHRALKRKSRRKLAVKKSATGSIQAVSMAQGWVELTAPSEFEYLSRLQRFTNLLFTNRLPEEECEALRMAMEEIGRNAIEWGNRLDPEKQLKISYCVFNDRVVLKFEDEGEGFHPEQVPDPSNDPGGIIAKREKQGKRPGGFGVFLINNIMDEVVYSEKGNVVLTTKFFSKT